MQELRANTAIIVRVGSFMDYQDGVTPETGVVLASGDAVELLKNNGVATVDISANLWTAVTNCNGFYDLTLTASNTDTEGLLDVVIQDADVHLPVRHSFMVLAEAAWDSKYVAKDDGLMDVNVKYVGDTLQTANDNGADINTLLINLGTVDTVADAISTIVSNLPDSGALTSLGTLANQNTLIANLSTVDTVVDAIKAITDDLEDTAIHVDGTNGNDANTGRGYAQARATIGEAVTDASDGDTIIIWPGTYNEAVSISGKALTLRGTNREKCKIQPAANTALDVDDYCVVENLSIDGSLTATYYGLSISLETGCVIRNCNIKGHSDGIYGLFASNALIEDCFVYGKYDGANFVSCSNIIVRNCVFETDGSSGTGNDSRAVICSGSVVFDNCVFEADRTDTTSNDLVGIWADAACQVVVNNSVFDVSAGASVTGYVAGVMAENANAMLTLNNCIFKTAGTNASWGGYGFSTGPYDIVASLGNISLTGCYAPLTAESSGTIYYGGTNFNSELLANLSTVDTVADAIKAVTDNLPDSGALSDIVARLTTIDTVADAVKAVTDNLPDSGALTDITARLTTVDTVVDAIKAITDNLPNSGNLTSLATLANQTTIITNLSTVDTVADTILTNLSTVDTVVDTLQTNLSTVDTVVDTLTVKLLKYVQLLSRKDAAIATDNATELTAINADGGSGAGAYDNAADALEALRDRGDTAWITGGGGGITDILNIQPMIPDSIDLATTATVRVGIGLTNMLDDLPTTAEITPGTINIDHKAVGGTSWTNLVSAAACSEAAGLIYYDEVFDLATGYAEGDSIRFTFKNQKITVDANDYEITGSDGWMFQTYIRSSSGGGGDATAANQTTIITHLTDIKGTDFVKDTDSLVDLEHANSGGGSVLYNYDITDTDAGLPIGDVSVTVSTDKRGVNVIASGRTNSSGRKTFYLDPGSYYFWSKKDGYNFTNPDLEVVS